MAPFSKLNVKASPTDFFTGLWLPARAISLIVTTPKLLALSVVGALITAATLVALAPLWWSQSQHWAEALVGADATWQKYTARLVGLLLFIVGYALSALTVPNVVLAPLQDPLSEATEASCGDFTAAPFSLRRFARGIVESLAHTALRLAFMLAGFALLWPLHFIPLVGSALWVVLSTGWSMGWLCVEHLSNPAARHLRPFGQVLGAVRQRWALALGFGASVWVLLWVPVLNFFLLPVAIVGGTLLFRSMQQVGLMNPPHPSGTKS